MWAAALAAVIAFQSDAQIQTRTETDGVATRADSVRPPPDSATLASAYLDASARRLVTLARDRRERVDGSIRSYEAIVRQHISVGVRAFRRDRILYRRESAARIEWHRLRPWRIEALGAREVVPIAFSDVRVPEDLDDFLPDLVYEPADDHLFGFGDNDYIRHPLAAGSEWDYRFATGDTTVLTLPDGRVIRLLELRVLPRESDSRLLSGALWLESESHAVVQAIFRLARPFDLERDAAKFGEEDEDFDEIPGLLKPIQAEVRYMTIEYGLWEMRWWLPRLIAFEAEARAGKLLRMPVRFERVYSDYTVHGDSSGLPPVRIDLAGDAAGVGCRGRSCNCRNGRCFRIRITMPEDSAALLASEYLPHSIFAQGEILADAEDLREVAALLAELPGAPAAVDPPRLYWGLDRPGLVRYNRVEGLSVGVRVEAGYGRTDADMTARIGTADLEPGIEIGLEREWLGQQLRLAGYRRLDAVDPAVRPFSIGNSIDALVLGRDDGDYLRSLGIELVGRRALPGTLDFDWRVFAERQSPVTAGTDFSLRGLVDDDVRFRELLTTDPADQLGAHIALRIRRGLDPTGFRWGTGLSLDAATGTFRFLRPSLTTHLAVPLPGSLVGSIEAAGGTSAGTPPSQALWSLGGSATLRGYDAQAARGTAFWRGRAEIATAFPAARVAVFSDAGWAGSREEIRFDDPLWSAGIGASLLDGLLRLDLARALRAPTGWRLHFYLDAAL